MKFWLLTTEYPPLSGGGISTYCWHTARMLAENNIQVTVFIPAVQSQSTRIVMQQENIRLIYFKASGNPQNSFLGHEAALSYQFSKVLKEFQEKDGEPDFIEAQEYNGIAYYPLQRRLLEENYLGKSCFFVTAHAPGFLYQEFNQAPRFKAPEYWVGEMEKSVLRSADFVISPSQYLLDKLAERMDLTELESTVIFNPLSSSDQPDSRDSGELVFFGKLIPQKGPIEMLQYFKELWDKGFERPIHIIGGGEHFFHPKMMDMGAYLRHKYETYIKRGLLRFEGHILPEKLHERLLNAQVVIVPSVVDNLPYTVLEVMLMGKIVLASAQGGHSELIENGENGFMFSHDDPQSFANTLHAILDLSKERAKEIGRKARKKILEECSYKTVFQTKMELLEVKRSPKRVSKFPFIRPQKRKLPLMPAGLVENLLSIVVPFYNLGEFIEECVVSLIQSDYSNKEIIIIDDGSSDSQSLRILEGVKTRYPVRVVRQDNRGLSAARNYGASLATGEYLAFLDADDKVNRTYFTKAIRVLKEYENVSFVGCWAQYFGDSRDVWPTFNPEPPYLLTHNMINSSALVYKTECCLSFGLNDPRMVYGMEDYDSVIGMVESGHGGVVLPEILWYYRIRRSSMAQAFNRYSQLYLYQIISAKHKEFFARYADEIVNILNANGPGMYYKNPAKTGARFGQILEDSTVVNWLKRNRILRNIASKMFEKIANR
ncbi:MAG: glycosyltransferase [Cyclobacteriaceae bacterium]|nr:glycosyltransferase [Cyclobacteriaceae bacterium]